MTESRELLAELQEALAPTTLPVLPGVTLAVRGSSAVSECAAGAEWFDAVPLPDGRVALVVGDVVGDGPAAAVAMAQLRAVLDELLVETVDLGATLARADRLAAREPALRAATLCVVALDPRDATLQYATFGHPAPLVVSPTGTTRPLAPSGAGPLGTGSAVVLTTDVIAPGDLVLLPTSVTGETVLAVQVRTPAAQPLAIRMPATVEAFSALRSQLKEWLSALGASASDAQSLELAIGELAANAVEHAYAQDAVGEVRVSAVLDLEGVLHAEVADDGAWQASDRPSATRGRGLWLAGEMVDELQVTRGGGSAGRTGTVVAVHRRLRRAAAIRVAFSGRDQDCTGGRTVKKVQVHVRSGANGSSAQVSGPVDIVTAPHFAECLNRATRGGAYPLTIDLSEVPMLSSAGIRVLFDLRDRMRGHGHALRLRAAAGSPAHDVLELAGLHPER